ncbi:hypothetical protein JIN84_06200 [Luteolibacter yonseiensis]|uniref:Ribbon-helix-helix protein CopG domain-containing protein n=1 Tax=Luteolibacter yonseiensis TaxID=1144680 RepID=A0A934VAI7_9BACT|nr:hypothetical protein [Luteolibacter yonseiensis]MBK1815195.1 hypothetical protein [Luteolibacter yonseiensis]
MKSKRLNLELKPEAHARLIRLQEEGNLSSIADVIRRALALSEMINDHVKNGGSVILRDRDNKEKEVMFF